MNACACLTDQQLQPAIYLLNFYGSKHVGLSGMQSALPCQQVLLLP